jgi:hypothetical protein
VLEFLDIDIDHLGDQLDCALDNSELFVESGIFDVAH